MWGFLGSEPVLCSLPQAFFEAFRASNPSKSCSSSYEINSVFKLLTDQALVSRSLINLSSIDRAFKFCMA